MDRQMYRYVNNKYINRQMDRWEKKEEKFV